MTAETYWDFWRSCVVSSLSLLFLHGTLSLPFRCSFCMGHCLFPFAALSAWDAASWKFPAGQPEQHTHPNWRWNHLALLLQITLYQVSRPIKTAPSPPQFVFWSLELQNNHPTTPQNAIPGTHGCERRRQVLSNSKLSNLDGSNGSNGSNARVHGCARCQDWVTQTWRLPLAKIQLQVLYICYTFNFSGPFWSVLWINQINQVLRKIQGRFGIPSFPTGKRTWSTHKSKNISLNSTEMRCRCWLQREISAEHSGRQFPSSPGATDLFTPHNESYIIYL